MRTSALTIYDGKFWDVGSSATFQDYKGEHIALPVSRFSNQLYRNIVVSPIVEFSSGFIPVALYASELKIKTPVQYWPEQFSYFSKKSFTSDYSFVTFQYSHKPNLLKSGTVIDKEEYVELPEIITERTRELADSLTQGLQTPYEKAKAIEQYLYSTYTYDLEYERAPTGVEPTDWFLFTEKRGVCINFNSAFVILARSAGIPARLVTGYAIRPVYEIQEVSTRQAHAWAEVPFQYFGWITFDATPSDNVPLIDDTIRKSGIVTETVIAEYKTTARKGYNLEVKGNVTAIDGKPVNGMTVEIFINEVKEKGGQLIGEGTVINGQFTIPCNINNEVNVGNYQLIAHARGNKVYAESWSDPELIIISDTVLEINLPVNAVVDEPVLIGCTLKEELGNPIPNMDITIRVSDGSLPVNLVTDENGNVSLNHVFREFGYINISVAFKGAEFFTSSEIETDIKVMMPTVLKLDVSDEAFPNTIVNISGNLNTERDEPLSDSKVQIFIDGVQEYSATTDTSGAFSLSHTFPSSGVYIIEARYRGSNFYLDSNDRVTINILDIVIDLDTDDVFIRKSDMKVSGRISTRNGAVTGEIIEISFDNTKIAELETGNSGNFKADYHVKSDTVLGKHFVSYQLEKYDRTRVQEVSVKSKTSMKAVVPEKTLKGSQFFIPVTLYDDNGRGIIGKDVIIREYFRYGPTDENGIVEIDTVVSEEEEGDSVSFDCIFEEDEFYLSSSISINIPLETASFPWWILVIVTVLIVTSISGYVVWQQKRLKQSEFGEKRLEITVSEFENPEPAADETDSNKTYMEIHLPQIKRPLPDVWGLDEELTIQFRIINSNKQPVKNVSLSVFIDSYQIAEPKTDNSGQAVITYLFRSSGEFTVQCRFDGIDELKASENNRTIRIVDYREEIVGLYETLKEWTETFGMVIPPNSTPRTNEIRLIREFKGINAVSVDTFLRNFEEADYSSHSIVRKHYEEAFLSLTKIKDSYGGEDEQGD